MFDPQANKDADIAAWKEYKRNPNPTTRSAVLKRFNGVIHAQVHQWAGPVSRDVLVNEAKILVAKALDTYNPAGGAALATHVTNALLPLSRVVYTYQNTARMPENVTMKINAFNTAVSEAKDLYGREPTTEELHSSLGWSAAEINRMREYNHKNLVESGPQISGNFFAKNTMDDDVMLGGIYMELTPQEKQLFEYITGYNHTTPLDNASVMKKLNLTQAQLSYRKNLLRTKLEKIMSRPGIRNTFGGGSRL